MQDGTSTMRTMVASSSIAMPRPNPICCRPMMSPAENAQKTETMIRAAPVIRRPVDRMPKATEAVLC